MSDMEENTDEAVPEDTVEVAEVEPEKEPEVVPVRKAIYKIPTLDRNYYSRFEFKHNLGTREVQISARESYGSAIATRTLIMDENTVLVTPIDADDDERTISFSAGDILIAIG
jgi:hypothetical protein